MSPRHGQADAETPNLTRSGSSRPAPARNRIWAALRELTADPTQATRPLIIEGYFAPHDIIRVSERLENSFIGRGNADFVLGSMAKEGIIPYICLMRGSRPYYQYGLPAADELHTPNIATKGSPAQPVRTLKPDETPKEVTARSRDVYIGNALWERVHHTVKRMRDHDLALEGEAEPPKTSSDLVRMALDHVITEAEAILSERDEVPTVAAHERLLQHLVTDENDGQQSPS